MADTFVERLTGQASAEDVNVEVQILVPVEALLDPDNPLPAQIPGHGPVPTSILATGKGKRAWRRLFTRNGHVVGGDPRRRLFTGVLAELIAARDGHRCREPFCDAPIRETDHITRWTDGGTTTFTDGRGYCQFHNLVRDTDGSTAVVVNDGLNGEPHTVRTTTATGHTYLSRACPASLHRIQGPGKVALRS